MLPNFSPNAPFAIPEGSDNNAEASDNPGMLPNFSPNAPFAISSGLDNNADTPGGASEDKPRAPISSPELFSFVLSPVSSLTASCANSSFVASRFSETFVFN